MCTDVVIEENTYYMVLKKLDGYDWSMLMLVPTSDHYAQMSLRVADNQLFILDQQALPQEKRWLDASTVEALVGHIHALRVRGAFTFLCRRGWWLHRARLLRCWSCCMGAASREVTWPPSRA